MPKLCFQNHPHSSSLIVLGFFGKQLKYYVKFIASSLAAFIIAEYITMNNYEESKYSRSQPLLHWNRFCLNQQGFGWDVTQLKR